MQNAKWRSGEALFAFCLLHFAFRPLARRALLAAALRKELLLQWRSRGQFLAVLVFGAAALLLFSFAIGPNAVALRTFSAGFLWLGLLLSSTLTLSESFHAEMENRALEGLLLLPSDPRALYYAKAIANWLQLTVLGVALVPVMVVLYDAGTTKLLTLLLVIMLGAAGLSAPGTLYAAMTAQLKAKQTLLPLLLFPLIVPALLASVKATSYVILGDPMNESKTWLGLLAAFDLIYWSLCGMLYERVIED
jgi:heme exporter protein B